ncbi:MAG: VTC domain-containing protein [Halioglobus sp.]|nr:VTC domain-containing protein [Halioglobus sp.]
MPQSNGLQRNDFRYELKVPYQRAQFTEFESWLQRAGLHPVKQYADRLIHSVYLDTSEFDDYQDNVSGISKRGKLRIRWYNDATDNMVLELKNKRGKLANKLIIKLDNPTGDLPFDRAIANRLLRSNERSMAVARQASLFPSLHVQYERAYYEIAPDIRMTIDRNIRYQSLYPIKSARTAASLIDVVIEFKYPTNKSKKAAELLAGMPGRIFRHSKYVIGVDTVCAL